MAIHYIESLANNRGDVNNLIAELLLSSIIGLDAETTGLDPYTDKILLLQLSVGKNIYVIHRYNMGDLFFVKLLELIKKHNILCVGHNIKYDIKMLKMDTDILLTNIHDTMIVESVLTAGIGEKLYSLARLLNKYLGIEISKEIREEFIGLDPSTKFTDRQITYAATDVLYLTALYDAQIKLASREKLTNIVNLEMELLPVVVGMELHGIHLDEEHWKNLIVENEKQLKEVGLKLRDVLFDSFDMSQFANAYEFAKAVSIPIKTKKLQKSLESIQDSKAALGWVKEMFNIGSPLQLVTSFRLAGIDTPNTNAKILNKLPKNPIIDTLLEYREYEKRLSTYGQNVIDLVNPVTKKIHTEYFQMGTHTGRFSSKNPNMQNIPTHGGYREGFVARPGYSFIAMDYSQQEYRLAGALSKEPAIIEAYISGFDMHIASAAKRYGKELKDVTKDERNKGKGINFTVLYGGTEYALGKNLDVPTNEAKSILAKFFADYPRLTAFKNEAENMIVKLGYSVTPMGRKRYFPPLPALGDPREIENLVRGIKREGFNMIIQGGGADVTKISMINMYKHNPFGDKFSLILQVHDEVVAEVEDSILKEAEDFMRKEMTGAFQPFLGEIPAMTDAKVSKRWTKS
jgi:DNA polymerase-1